MEVPLTVAAVMTPHPFSVTPETGFEDIAALLVQEGLSTVPVVDGDGMPVGVVSEVDLPGEGHDGDGAGRGLPTRRHSRRRRRYPRRRARCARDVMTAWAPTVDTGTTVAEAARELAAYRLRRVFVVDEGGRLVGVVARPDLLGVYFRSDDDVQRDIEDEVFGRVLRADPASFKVGVEHGVVTVLGKLERRSAVSSAERLIPLVPGVTGVRSRLSYVWDDEWS
jgi:CBS domain-containing protein